MRAPFVSSYTAFLLALTYLASAVFMGSAIGIAFADQPKPPKPKVIVPIVDDLEDIDTFKKEGFGKLMQAARFGVLPYGELKSELQGTCLEAHHLLEQRFAPQLGRRPRDMLSVAVTDDEHQVFTNAWRKAIPYGKKTRKATLDQIHGAACQIYKGHQAFLDALNIDCPYDRDR